MGLAWTADEAGHPVLPGLDGPATGHRHRRPTLLARSAHKITRLAGTGPAAGQRHEVTATHPPRRRTMAARKYGT
jgi:hypothetical protein